MLQAINFTTTLKELQWLGFDKDADQVRCWLCCSSCRLAYDCQAATACAG